MDINQRNAGARPRAGWAGSLGSAQLMLLVVVLYTIFVVLRVWVHGKDPSSCIGASRSFCDVRMMPAPIQIQEEARVYDGQFFYRLALNPWSTDKEAMGIHFDHPSYRHQRVGYPLVCWLLSFGKPKAVAWVMILVNLLWLGVLTVVCVRWVQEMGQSPLWGLLPLLWPGFLISLGRDLCEIQGVALLVMGSWLLVKERPFWGALALTGAALTRETLMLPIAGLGLYYAWIALCGRKKSDWLRLCWLLLPAIILLGWHAYLRMRYGVWPVKGLITIVPPWSPTPFKGLVAFICQGLPFEGTVLSETSGGLSNIGGLSRHTAQLLYYIYRCGLLGLCLLITLLAACSLTTSRTSNAVKIAWFFAGFLFYGLMDWVWAMGPSSFMRVGADCSALGLLLIATNGKVCRWLALGAAGAAWSAGLICYIVW